MKEATLKITVPFEAALNAFLQTLSPKKARAKKKVRK
jgi:hypothetical protein